MAATGAAATASTAKPTPTAADAAFYDQLTLGLIRVLKATPRIANVVLDGRAPCERAAVAAWEQKHSVYLPDDMRRFYLSTDGFTLHWSYQYTPEDLLRVGFLCFVPLAQIALLREPIETFLTPPPSIGGAADNQRPSASSSSAPLQQPALTARSKIFELSAICDLAKVCLIYEQPDSQSPAIYLLELGAQRWHPLADTFGEYVRMALVHLGLPAWELCFSPCALPAWTEQLFLLLAPHLLERSGGGGGGGGEMQRPQHRQRLAARAPQPPFNQLDASVFRTATRATAKAAQAAAATTSMATVGAGRLNGRKA